MKPVVVGVDGSADALHAVRWAAEEAHGRHRPLQIVHCSLFVEALRSAAEQDPTILAALSERAEGVVQRARDAAAVVAPALDVVTTVVPDLAIPGVLGVTADAELLVLGARGVGAFEQLLLGSTSREVVASADCPVVVVRGGFTDHGHIVVGIDGSALSMNAVEFAFTEAAWRDAVLVAVHACGFPHSQHDLSHALRDQLQAIEVDERIAVQETLAGWREEHPDVKVEEVFGHDQPLAALIEQSKTADLVVVGSRGRSATKSLLLGSVAHSLLRHACSPVAVVHG
jgi:nucleotide-binding universal stress UspA family protein